MLAIKLPRLAFFSAVLLAAVVIYGLSTFPPSRHQASDLSPAKHPDASEAVTQAPGSPLPASGTAATDSPEVLPEVLPAFLERHFLTASLSALEKNGSDLSLPMPSKHLIRCESREIASQVSAWGRENGFEPLDGGIFLGHGGVEFFDVELRRTEVPDATRIQEQGRLVQENVAELAGAEYATWVGEIVPAR